MKFIRFHPGADAEVEAETRYYRRQAGAEVSRRFVEAVERATPRLPPRWRGIVVFAVVHHSREPGYWRARS